MTGKQITNPMQALLRRAAATLPAETGRVAAQQTRIDRRSGAYVILVDVSMSMDAPAWGGLRKIDVLRQAVDATLRRSPQCRLIAFSKHAREVTCVPEPESNTDLVAGLEAARTHDPGVTLLISDGQPDNADAALSIAERWRGAIDVLYVGPDSDAAAIAFMRRLAAAAAGDVCVNDIGKAGAGVAQLTQSISALLPGPAR